jgi:hypothetical protein
MCDSEVASAGQKRHHTQTGPSATSPNLMAPEDAPMLSAAPNAASATSSELSGTDGGDKLVGKLCWHVIDHGFIRGERLRRVLVELQHSGPKPSVRCLHDVPLPHLCNHPTCGAVGRYAP